MTIVDSFLWKSADQKLNCQLDLIDESPNPIVMP